MFLVMIRPKFTNVLPPILFATEYYILDVFACLNVYVDSTVKAN